MLDLVNKTPAELQALITEAQQQLAEKQKAMRKEVIAQIKDLAASIGATVEVNFEQPMEKFGGRKRGGQTGKVTAKYQNPANPQETWTGRGVAPKWMQELIASGRNKDEFLIDKGQ
ncbi:H-NS histone family protein [Methylosarcina fibrata]|jgi:DNA-binding protein H-NS|uniref:H-NS histone family protein n=1 Tax=Methylosarcina fibrata TaxID=105972 RepID=UPI00035DEF32|nr:H-NS histone family protein [Methylosarcina fibrata]